MAAATELRTLGLKGVWGQCPQPRVPPLHPVLTRMAMAIKDACLYTLVALDALELLVQVDRDDTCSLPKWTTNLRGKPKTRQPIV